ncbi:Carbonic anhydrase [Methylophaga frappieri]|uniref:Carbonic anhydrase n=1 Tax=Methylophaga frappieri (strain ATCC BAA-2434 / DSM 25690 / JAM7) TaxID=754477 RepID=I1YGY5_METFJ|nr:carbonic anhydrase [Methylophaga frappieri]AFJ02178.1 Carbonic anhydrase [Methylophaga frappieri]
MAKTEALISGFQRFKQRYFGDNQGLYDSMKTGQPAKILMIACSDSRVDPAILTDCDPGDLFIVRNVANLVPPREDDGHYHGTSAALEFAVDHLQVENIIVMGHANCGGIRALWQHDGNHNASQFIHRWVSIAESAKNWVRLHHANESESTCLQACEQQGVLVSLENLLTFENVRKRVESGQLKLHGWYFDLTAGELKCYNPATQRFEQAVA